MCTNQPPFPDLTAFVSQSLVQSQNLPRISSSSAGSIASTSSGTIFENVHYIPHVSSLLQSPLPSSRPQQLIVGSHTLIQSSPTMPNHMRLPPPSIMQLPQNISPQRIRAVLPPNSRPIPTASLSVPNAVRSFSQTGKNRDELYKRKYQLLKKCIKSLVFKNAALSDEVARLHQRINTVTEERKVLLRKLLTHERRRASAAIKKANRTTQPNTKKVDTIKEEITTVIV